MGPWVLSVLPLKYPYIGFMKQAPGTWKMFLESFCKASDSYRIQISYLSWVRTHQQMAPNDKSDPRIVTRQPDRLTLRIHLILYNYNILKNNHGWEQLALPRRINHCLTDFRKRPNYFPLKFHSNKMTFDCALNKTGNTDDFY